jgi:hypothetical protein
MLFLLDVRVLQNAMNVTCVKNRFPQKRQTADHGAGSSAFALDRINPSAEYTMPPPLSLARSRCCFPNQSSGRRIFLLSMHSLRSPAQKVFHKSIGSVLAWRPE